MFIKFRLFNTRSYRRQTVDIEITHALASVATTVVCHESIASNKLVKIHNNPRHRDDRSESGILGRVLFTFAIL